jgi:hypothetical protein
MPGVTGWRVPVGMGCVYDFAIDKYKAHADDNETLDDKTEFSKSLLRNGTSAIFRSLPSRTPVKASWYAFKKGCDNRTAEVEKAGFLMSGDGPLNRVRMPTGVEWVVAANTADEVNETGRDNMESWFSRFGTLDQPIGIGEWTDEIFATAEPGPNISNMAWYRFFGTSDATSFPEGISSGSVPAIVMSNPEQRRLIVNWDLLTGFPSALTSITFSPPLLDLFEPRWVSALRATYVRHLSQNLKRSAASRGTTGVWKFNSRFSLTLEHPSGQWPTHLSGSGGRCVLSSPLRTLPKREYEEDDIAP